MRLVVLAAWFVSSAALAAEDDPSYSDNTVDVTGARREAEAVDRPGTSYVFRPEGATRFDTKAQLGRSASLALPETGRINAAGFVIPRIRGQDTRLTEVYVGDLLMQDPYTGLPLVDDLDLRAFGELALHQGVAPLELPTIGGVGVIQYRPRPITGNQTTIGATSGKPYGVAGFGLVEGVASPVRARLYLRQHVTDGRYSYFDDGGTPYNTADDVERKRTGNDRRSYQVVPTLVWQKGPDRVQALGLWQKARSGLPASHVNDPPSRETSGVHLSSVRYERRLAGDHPLTPDAWHVDGGHHDDVRERGGTDDAVGSSGTSKLAVRTRRLGTGVAWQMKQHTVRLDVDANRTQIKQAALASTTLRRDAQGGHLGWGWTPSLGWRLETKGTWRRHTDVSDGDDTRQDQFVRQSHDRRDHRGASTALGWQGDIWSLYAQGALRERPPSLLEEFGDAAYVRGNPDLVSEKSRHWELGTRLSDRRRIARIGAALFQDKTSDRLLFAPSLAQSVRALNVGRADVRGIDVTGDAEFGMTGAALSVTRLWPEDRTVASDVRQLPGVPEWQAAAMLSQRVGSVTARWQSRYRGEMYRDVLNDTEIPPALIHAAALDAAWAPAATLAIDAGLAVDNVTDVKSLPIKARGGTEQSGETAYGDVAGMPLPGRQWRATATATYRW